MAQGNAPLNQFEFTGMYATGHPLKRPHSSANDCYNLRVMPGGYLRLRGGRQYRTNLGSYNVRRILDVPLNTISGSSVQSNHFVFKEAGGVAYWDRLYLLAPYEYSFFRVAPCTISGTTGYTSGDFPACCSARDRIVFYNGLGYQNSTGGYPPFGQFKVDSSQQGHISYFGLDAVTNGTVGMTHAGPGTTNQVLYRRKIYVGIHNQDTGHFSNGVYVGQIISPSPGVTWATGDLTITSLDNLKMVRYPHSGETATQTPSNEHLNLKYVFYVTMDGGAVPYLLLDGTTGNMVTASYGATTKSLAIASSDGTGWTLDPTAEMPTTNNPPKPMSTICYANGRMYGALLKGAGQNDYAVQNRDLNAVVFSAAADDYQDRDFLGAPEESWPETNKKYTPNGERPLAVAPAMSASCVLVITKTATYLLEETADGLHTWDVVSGVSGIWSPSTLVLTRHGYVWMDQNKQLVLMPNHSRELVVISGKYALYMTGNWPDNPPATYVHEPVHQIDRYEIWNGNISQIHDFLMDTGYRAAGVHQVGAAGSLLDSEGKQHFMLSHNGLLFTQETQPDTGYIPMRDDTGASTTAEIQGDWLGNYMDFGDSSDRKEFREIEIIGDGKFSDQLGDCPIRVSVYPDISEDAIPVDLYKAPQSDSDYAYRGKIRTGHTKYIRLLVAINGHTEDPENVNNSYLPSGTLQPHGTIWGMRLVMNSTGNR